jgi:hypothetical protein
MKVKGRGWKRARRHWVVRYWLAPLAWAVGSAVLFGAFMFLRALSGYEGRHGGFTHRHSAAEAWRDVPLFAGMIFVITFVVLMVFVRVRSRSR